LTRTSPGTSFGPRLQQVPPLTATLEDLAAAVAEVEKYALVHSPGLLSELALMRTRLKAMAERPA
jgi:hypothetical protein